MASKGGGKVAGGGLYLTAKDFTALGQDRDTFQNMPVQVQETLLAAHFKKQGVFIDGYEAEEYLKSDAFKKTFTATDQKGLEEYTGGRVGHTDEIQTGLYQHARQGKTGVPEGIQTYVTDLDAALQKLPAFRGTLLRTMEVTPKFETEGETYNQAVAKLGRSFQRREGKLLSSPTYMSTTASSSPVLHQQNIKMHIHAKGKHGRAIMGLSTIPFEREVLFERGTKFRIGKVNIRMPQQPWETTRVDINLYEV